MGWDGEDRLQLSQWVVLTSSGVPWFWLQALYGLILLELLFWGSHKSPSLFIVLSMLRSVCDDNPDSSPKPVLILTMY